jgi:hypothetical protein
MPWTPGESLAADDDTRPCVNTNCRVAIQRNRAGASVESWMAWTFGLGSTCFLVGPVPAYLDLVGPAADGITFFVGSVLFTIGGGLQTWLAAPRRGADPAGRAAWWAATVQSLGTLFFNVTTLRALQVTLSDPHYDRLVWRPDALGSVCFLVSGAVAYLASGRLGWLPRRTGPGWWQPGVNLVGCVFFGVAAVAGYVVGSSSSVVDQAAANVSTAAGAACFLACAVASGRAARSEGRPGHGTRGTGRAGITRAG